MAEPDPSDKIHVRQVTNVHANWSAQDNDSPGKFSFQLILDNGAEEHLVRPPAEDSDVLKDLFSESSQTFYDTSRGVVIFRDVR